jgi:hypothetical protein
MGKPIVIDRLFLFISLTKNTKPYFNNMIVLREQETEQTLKAIIYGCYADRIVLIDEETGNETEIEIEFYIDTYFVSTNLIFPIVENKYYILLIKNGNDIVYKDKIFCTNQTIADYSINKDVYVQNVTNNNFIITD